MHHFTIRDIENLTGIKAHTLRIWEQRYQFFQPKRKESKHRFYDNDDLKTLLCVSFLYHNGYKISKIAALPGEEMKALVHELQPASKHETYAKKLLNAAIDFNENEFNVILDTVIRRIGFIKCIEEVCFPFLQTVGLLWDTSNVIPAQEHFSSYLIQTRIISETNNIEVASEEPPEIVLFTPPGEYHELPLLYLNYLFRLNGWRVLYIGTNVQPKELAEVVQGKSIRFIYFNLITNFTGGTLEEFILEMQQTFPDKIIAVSGSHLSSLNPPSKKVVLLKDKKQIQDFVYRKHHLFGIT